MRELCRFEAIPYVCLKAAITLEMKFTYCGVIYDPAEDPRRTETKP